MPRENVKTYLLPIENDHEDMDLGVLISEDKEITEVEAKPVRQSSLRHSLTETDEENRNREGIPATENNINKIKNSLKHASTKEEENSNKEEILIKNPLISVSQSIPKRSHTENSVNMSIQEISADDCATSEGNQVNLISDDPGMWPAVISNEMVEILVKRGPLQIEDFDFPVSNTGRKFSKTYYYRDLKNGEKVHRDWLIYSLSNDSVYCFCCKIFDSSKGVISDKSGFSDWQHLSITLGRHERSLTHKENIKKWITLINSLKANTSLVNLNQRIIDSERQHWYGVIERIICIIQYLSRQSLALRGSSNALYKHDNGNFLKAVEMIARFDGVMREHIQRIEKFKDANQRMPHYLGDKIQNEIINIIGSKIKNTILNLIRKAKYFSIILDCTPDVSHVEQITIIIRFVLLEEKRVEIREHFLGFSPITSSTGEALSEFLLAELSKLKLNVYDMRGQGYDNGANMAGIRKGLKKKILDVNPRAFFIPCSAHSLNLVVQDSASISHHTVQFFDLVQEIYIFFSSSTQRWATFKKYLPNFSLKPLSGTRWSSRVDALKPLRYSLIEIYDALYEISKDETKEFKTRHAANCLLSKISCYKFICSIIIWYKILNEINIVSKMMQNPKINIETTIKFITDLVKMLKEYRTDDKYFDDVLDKATKIADELEVESEFSDESRRIRRKPKNFNYEGKDEPILDPKANFKINFFYCIIDQTLSSIESRFEALSEINKIFGFMFHLKDISSEKLLESCDNLRNKLTDTQRNEADIESIDLFNEILSLKTHINLENMDPHSVLEYIVKNELQSTFSNVFIAIRILLTLPMSVASGERSFSKLKLIKNYLRSTMLQERLENLSIISIEHELLDKLDVQDIISEFALQKARKTYFL